MALTRDKFQRAANIKTELANKWFEPINDAMTKFGITSPLDQAMFIAQIGHESGGFTATTESFNYSVAGLKAIFGKRLTAQQCEQLGRQPNETRVPTVRQEVIANTVYGGRMGNDEPGDGWKYRGHGPIQTTGKSNFAITGKNLGLDLVNKPELLLDPKNGAMAAAEFYTRNGCLNHTGNVTGVTRIINGGTNGLEDRQKRYAVALAVLTA